MYVVYALEDPRDTKVRYVGMTSDVYKRFIQHISLDGDNQEKNMWIDSLRSLGMLPIMRTLETSYKRNIALERERYWINHYTYLDMPLFNIVAPARFKEPPISSAMYKKDAVLNFIQKGYSQNEILKHVWGIKSAGRAYQKANEELKVVLASLMPPHDIEDHTLALVREMLTYHKSQNEIVAAVFPGMRNADAIVEYRRLLATLAAMA